MPKLDEKQIQASIADGSIVAITLDTNVFDKYGRNLDFKIFSSLSQLQSDGIGVVFSEIVIQEVQRHISDDAIEAERALKKALKKQKSLWKADFDVDTTLNTSKRGLTPKALAQEQIAKFLKSVGGEIIPASGKVDVSGEVLRRYFSGEYPFEKNEAKKHEFPDAFALLSLEKAFPADGKMLLCVSNDGGWKKFSETSDTLVCVDAIDTALSYFEHGGRSAVQKAVNLLVAGNAPLLVEAMESEIDFQLSEADFIAICASDFDYESEPVGGEVQNINTGTVSKVKIVSSSDEEVSFTFKIEVSVEFEAAFHFQTYDSIDKEHISLGTEYATVNTDLNLMMLVTISRSDDDEPEVSHIEVLKKGHMEFHFGYVNPFSYDDWADEEY